MEIWIKENHPWIQRRWSGSSNLFVDKTKSIVAFKISKLTSSLKDSFKDTSHDWITFVKYCTVGFINIVQERRSFSVKQGTVEKIMRCGFYIDATATKRIQNILEAVLKLMLSKMT